IHIESHRDQVQPGRYDIENSIIVGAGSILRIGNCEIRGFTQPNNELPRIARTANGLEVSPQLWTGGNVAEDIRFEVCSQYFAANKAVFTSKSTVLANLLAGSSCNHI